MKPIVEQQAPHAANELVACELVRGKDFGCVWHHHPEYEITLVRKGGTERWVGDRLTPLRPGDLVLLGSGLPHDYRNERGRGPVDAVVLQFRPNFLGEDWLKHASVSAIARLLDRARLGLEVRGATRRTATKMIEQSPKLRGVGRLVLLLQLLELLAGSDELKEIATPGFRADTDAHSSDRIGAVTRHIEESLSGQIYVSTLARMTGLSESAFSRLFHKCTGRSVPQYVNELRIARACRLLAETDQTVKQVAHVCGYPTPAYFHRQFHRQHGVSPLAYRAAIRRHA